MKENDTNTNSPINSKSYIILDCGSEGGKLYLRTDPPAFIDLKEGENILTIEDYPALKYGFMAGYYEDNRFYGGLNVKNIDFSHFDSSEMTCMDEMFREVHFECNEIKGLDTSNVTSMKSTFQSAEFDIDGEFKIEVDTRNVEDMSFLFYFIYGDFEKLNFDTRNVKNMDGMFMWASDGPWRHLDLDSFDVSSVTSMKEIFNIFYLHYINLNGWQISSKDVVKGMFIDWLPYNRYPDATISLKGCDTTTIKWICEEFIEFLSELDVPEEDKGNYNWMDYIEVDDNVSVSLDLETKEVTVKDKYENVFNKSDLLIFDKDSVIGIKNKNDKVAFVPNGVKVIKQDAFRGCEDLHTVVLPSTLIEIQAGAFDGCKNLRWINIPNSVKYIGTRAFAECENLKVLHLGSDTERIDIEAFEDSGLEIIYIPLSVKKAHRCMNEAHSLKIINLYKPWNKGREDIDWEAYRFTQDDFGYENPIINILESERNTPATINGVYIDDMEVDEDDFEEEYYDQDGNSFYDNIFRSAIIIPNSTLAVPYGVDYLHENCISFNRNCPVLYIPDTVILIHPEAFGKNDLKFVTNKENIDNLIDILPKGWKDNAIYVI